MMTATEAEPRRSASTVSSSVLDGHNCVVTGASSGIGREIAVELALAGATVCAVARRRDELEVTATLGRGGGQFELFEADLVDDEQVERLGETLLARESGVHVLVHSAGTISRGDLEKASISDLDRQYAANVRAPYLLTQILLPALCAIEGQIVFINSTAGRIARANTGQYAATQHARRAIADSLREEINPKGVRVVTVYPGRTATPLQAKIHEIEGKSYVPERLMQPGDVASVVVNALTLPRSAELTEVSIRPMLKH
jgi:NADP-dependent 3-hydroxy acid dehydrogenase YdfG